jgi:hypothetical protein
MTYADWAQQRSVMIAYLTMKVGQHDWHGVADAAMDLRDLEEHRTYLTEVPAEVRW